MPSSLAVSRRPPAVLFTGNSKESDEQKSTRTHVPLRIPAMPFSSITRRCTLEISEHRPTYRPYLSLAQSQRRNELSARLCEVQTAHDVRVHTLARASTRCLGEAERSVEISRSISSSFARALEFAPFPPFCPLRRISREFEMLENSRKAPRSLNHGLHRGDRAYQPEQFNRTQRRPLRSFVKDHH